jgi:hypothetical protein
LIIGQIGFVHGGLSLLLTTDYLKYNYDINDIIRNYIFYKNNSIYVNKDTDLIFKNMLYNSNYSPLWYRKLGMLTPDQFNKTQKDKLDCNKLLNSTFQTFKLSNLIIGHTPQFSLYNLGINSACDEKIFRVDIGASRAFENIIEKEEHLKYRESREPQVLEILYDNNKYSFNILK